MNEMEQVVNDAVKLALACGASNAEATASEGDEFSAEVRMGEIEKLTDAGSRGAGIRVLIGKNSGSSYTSDLTADGIEQMVKAAIEIAQITSNDRFAGLPDQAELGSFGSLALYDEEIARLETEWKIERAK